MSKQNCTAAQKLAWRNHPKPVGTVLINKIADNMGQHQRRYHSVDIKKPLHTVHSGVSCVMVFNLLRNIPRRFRSSRKAGLVQNQ